MNEPSLYAVDEIRKIQAFSSLREGYTLQRAIPGLRQAMFRILWLNYLIFAAVTLLLNGLLYFFVLEPLISWMFGSDGGIWATLGQWLLWLMQLSVAAVFAVVSLRFSIELSGIWHQQLVARVIRHYREIPEVRLSFREWLGTLLLGVKQMLKIILFLLMLIFASLIPVIGIVIVFVVESQMLGSDVVNVYIDELSGIDNMDILKGMLKWTPLKLGWLPMMLAFVPIAGWALMPLLLMLQVIGFASQLEKARA